MKRLAIVVGVVAALALGAAHAQQASCSGVTVWPYRYVKCPDGSRAIAAYVGNEEYWKVWDSAGRLTYWRVWYVGGYSYSEQTSDPGPYYIPDESPYYIPDGSIYAR